LRSARRWRVAMGEKSLVLSVEEAAELLGISRGLAYELVRRRELPAIRLGRRLVVPRRKLLALVEGDELETSAG
jgi:excisionase family DNA binding protein